jgi:uncharacterized protein YcaQ
MNPFTLSKSQARKIILHAAGLDRPAPFGEGPEAVYRLIDHLGFIQIDTNYVVERAHHHTIAARVPGYQPEWLTELQEDGRIFEFLTSDAGYIPMHDFRFSMPAKESFATARKPITKGQLHLMIEILDRVGREGPLMVTDFEYDRLEPSAGWWDWRPSKVALEQLYLEGSLMTTRKKDFRKVYDLPDNLVPGEIDRTTPSPGEFARYIIRRTLGALGICYVKEISWRARHVKNNAIKQELEKLVNEGEICTVTVEGLKSAPLYMRSADNDKTIHLSGDAWILSPFDTLNVFRHRLKDFFDFDYQIECFVPQPKRKYGYFSLPVLVGDTFAARMDAKADRKQKELIVHNLHFEEVELSKAQLGKVADAIKAFVKFNQCHNVSIKKSNQHQYLAALLKDLS